jgi:hypothetical protein
MKAQLWSMDFMISIIIMIMVLVPAFMLWQSSISEAGQQKKMMTAETDALSITDGMIATPGVPSDWNSSTVVTVGFANEKNIFDGTKLDNFNATSYSRLRTMFAHDFYFELRDVNGTIYYTKGTKPPSTIDNVIQVQRRGLYNERIVIMDFALWY